VSLVPAFGLQKDCDPCPRRRASWLHFPPEEFRATAVGEVAARTVQVDYHGWRLMGP
jgi:hypothetical protein